MIPDDLDASILTDVRPDNSTYRHARDVAVDAARGAARLIRDYEGRLRRDEVRTKGPNDLVTDADVASQRLIVEHLLDTFPDHDVLAEEGDAADGPEAAPDGYRWIIDPIDGTTNFTRGVPPYAVSIALQHAGRVVVGVVLDVTRDELFSAVRGEGLEVDGRGARVSATPAVSESLVTTGFPYRSMDHLQPYLEVLSGFMEGSRGVRRPGSASIDLAYVAAGRFDGFFETGLSAWDVAAGSLLVEEAGGRVTDFRGTPETLFASEILATNGHVHDEMLGMLEPLRDARS